MAFVNSFGTPSLFHGRQPRSKSSYHVETRLCRRTKWRPPIISMAGDVRGGEQGGGTGGNREPPSGRSISQILEVTFRAVWIKLMTVGVGEGYEMALKQFVMGCMAAYKAGYTLMALKLELAANEIGGKVKVGVDEKGMVQTEASEKGGKTVEVDVGLRQQEKDTRMIWIKLVYLTLDRFRFVRESAPVPLETAARGTSDEDMVRGLAALVQMTVDAWKRGYTLQTLKMENMLKKNEEKELTPAEKSIRSQWMRIVFLTIDLIPEQYKKK